jgi:hypothetical protein
MQDPHRKSSEFLWRCEKNVWTGDIDNLSKLRVNQTLTDLPTSQMDKPHENAAGKDGSLQHGALLRKQEPTVKSDQTLRAYHGQVGIATETPADVQSSQLRPSVRAATSVKEICFAEAGEDSFQPST